MTDLTPKDRARLYAELWGIRIDFDNRLGEGTDGWVGESDRKSAVKAVERRSNYDQEVECYRRLKEENITRIRQFSVPSLFGYDDRLMVIEMSLVRPPYLLDFGKVYLDYPPGEEDNWRAQRNEEIEELFDDRAREVRLLMAALERYGIYYLDPKPGNIMFARQEPAS